MPIPQSPAYHLAYHIAFNCYGRWLHGDDPSSVDRHHNGLGDTPLQPNQSLRAFELDELSQPPYSMDSPRRKAVLEAIREVCQYRGWKLLAAHVRTGHVHTVVQASAAPEKVMNDFKAYAGRRLNREGFDTRERKRWARHGSTTYKWTWPEVQNAVDYVLRKQGEQMEVHELGSEEAEG